MNQVANSEGSTKIRPSHSRSSSVKSSWTFTHESTLENSTTDEDGHDGHAYCSADSAMGPLCMVQCPGMPDHKVSALRKKDEDGVIESGVSWLSRTLCSLPSTPALDSSVDENVGTFDTRENSSSLRSTMGLMSDDDNTEMFDSRADFETKQCDERCPERQGPVGQNFDVEIDDYDDTQIEVTHSSDEETHKTSQQVRPTDTEPRTARALSPLLHKQLDDVMTAFKQEDGVFNSFLESNGFICSGLDSWYSADESQLDIAECCETEMPRNRSNFPEGRKKRIERLKINLTPFELEDSAFIKSYVNSERYSPVELDKRIQSFSAFKTPSPTSVKDLPSQSQNLQCYNFPTCGNVGVNSAALVDWDEKDEEDLCYDSDPNEILVSRAMAIQAKRDRSRRKQEEGSVVKPFTVSQLMGTKILLVWHRPSHSEPSPTAVHAWIEHGSYIQAGLIQPKLMWQESCAIEQKNKDRSVLNTMAFHTIDLLDISKVVPLNRVDRDVYPFAKKTCCFIIHAYERQMLFEAGSTAERDEFIEGLKILVARLGSKIIVGDRDVLEEFFTPASSAVPGKVPDIVSDC